MSEIEAKVRYVKLARFLKTYGVSFFLVKVSSDLLMAFFMSKFLPFPVSLNSLVCLSHHGFLLPCTSCLLSVLSSAYASIRSRALTWAYL